MTKQPHPEAAGNDRGWIDLHLYAMALVALLSGLLLWWTNASWRENFDAYPPVLNNLRHARADIVRGYLLVERQLAGEMHIRLADADAFFEQAVHRVADAGQALRVAGGKSHLAQNTTQVLANLDSYGKAIVHFQTVAGQGMTADDAGRKRQEVERQAAFASLEKLADTLDDEIQRRISAAAMRQDRLNSVLFFVWLTFLGGLAASLALAGARRRKAEKAMLESEEKYRLLFDQVVDVILLVDEDTGNILDCNQAVTSEWGYDREELLGQGAGLLRSASSLAGSDDSIDVRYQNGRRAILRESRVATHYGDVRDVSIKTGFFVLNGRQVRLDIFRDVTERKKNETALVEREAILRSLGDNLPDGVIYKIEVYPDGNRRFLHVSQGVERVLGLPAARVLADAQNVFNRIVPEDREALRRAEAESVARLATFDVRARIQAADGSIRWGQFRAAPRRIDAGTVLFDGIFFDVTGQKRTEDSLRQAKAEAEAASQSKSEFLANISHEVRTPLNGVLGMLQLLATSADLPPEAAAHVSTALSCGRGLVRVLADILDFSLIDAGRLVLRRDACDIRGVLDDVLGVLSIECEKKGLRVELDVDHGVPPYVETDAARLRQILFNVIGNAVKFTLAGEVRVAVAVVSRQRRGLHLLFSVCDTGIGIPESKLDAIFEPFTQLDGSFTRKYGGMGLGLGIVKRLIGLLDGALVVESEVGRGTSFSFAVRCGETTALPTQGTSKSAREVRPGGQVRVLVVEDEAVNRMATVAMLKKLGYAAEAVEDGDQAPKALATEAFDVVLMDIQMPRVSGDEATRRIRQGCHPGVDPDIPIIALTAHAMDGDRERYLACGMDDYLSKPVELSALGRAVARAAARRAPAET